jgi:hypothetical protein
MTTLVWWLSLAYPMGNTKLLAISIICDVFDQYEIVYTMLNKDDSSTCRIIVIQVSDLVIKAYSSLN